MPVKSIGKKVAGINAAVLLILTVIAGLALSSQMSEYVIQGMELAVKCVIPSSFPFMIISDFYTHYGTPEKLGRIGKVFCKILGISPNMIGALICGNVGGFPIGAKMSAELYATKCDKKCEYERLIPLSSNPSVAFIIGGVGLGMYQDVDIGFVLAASVYSSMLLCAIITRPKNINFDYIDDNFKQKYSFVSSVKQSGSNCVSLIAFISIFSVAVGLIINHLNFGFLPYTIITFLEVTNALKLFASSADFVMPVKIALSGFSLGFGGISVMMQSAVFLEGTDLNLKKYVYIKLLQGILCGSISTLLFLIFR